VSLTTHDITLESLDAITGVEAICLFVAAGDRPLRGLAGFLDWRMCGALSRLLLKDFFTGGEEDVLLVTTNGRIPVARAFVLGTGTQKPTAESVGALLKRAAHTMRKAGIESVAVEVPGGGQVEDAVRATALQNHFLPIFATGSVAVLGEKSFCRYLASTAKG
jgi:hypothetical protein